MREAEPLSDAEIAEIEDRVNAATEGPWAAYGPISLHDGGYHYTEIVTAPDNPPKIGETDSEGRIACGVALKRGYADNHENDALFIAAARTDVPRLIATVRALQVRNHVRDDMGSIP